ncbi:hypothetical protein ACFV1L_10350 [Kitasatospora sp. NPDC059646]|uniref:hypothetical protein n=1 Tax=Kitasatospora sp. NPDC059646 TaxID=3346893 RepID=UPI0036BADABD
MTIEEHAKAIQAAIDAAAADGFELDNGCCEPLYRVELNRIVDGDFVGDPVRIDVPATFD